MNSLYTSFVGSPVEGISFPNSLASCAMSLYSVSAMFFSLQLRYIVFRLMLFFCATSSICVVVCCTDTVFPVPVGPYMNRFDGLSTRSAGASMFAICFI